MLLEAAHLGKTIGARYLFADVSFTLMPGEKVALIGRNGYGKTTLLRILSGEDHDHEGTIATRSGIQITLTQQEHVHVQQSPLDYILDSVPDYHTYKQILDDYEQGKNARLKQYLKTVEVFTEKRYYHLADAVLSTLADFGIAQAAAHQPLHNLSGGQKRYVEMTRMMFSQADLLLIDEPTNHLDYLGKERFISWMKSLKQTVVVVTHDRDVLQNVTKIFELKDQRIEVFKGNYEHYISQNVSQTLHSVKQYQDQLNRLREAKKKVDWGLQMRAKSKQWKVRYDHWLRDYERLKAQTVQPSFWIDQNSVAELDQKVTDTYHKFKERTITIGSSAHQGGGGLLLKVRNLAVGYNEPLFTNLSFAVRDADRVFLKGRNGAGKSTLVRTLVSAVQGTEARAVILDGEISIENSLRIGEYEQEISDRYLSLSLGDAVRECYQAHGVALAESKVKSLLAQYLFDPIMDAQQRIAHLSGGQKARFQLIQMFSNSPNLLILDEPTNHLDLPSIEELEKALARFRGGVLYISHDSYFIQHMGGSVVEL